MIDLIYPYDLAPVIPPPTAETTEESRNVSEWFPVVEPTGVVIGRSSRQYCHGGAKTTPPRDTYPYNRQNVKDIPAEALYA